MEEALDVVNSLEQNLKKNGKKRKLRDIDAKIEEAVSF